MARHEEMLANSEERLFNNARWLDQSPISRDDMDIDKMHAIRKYDSRTADHTSQVLATGPAVPCAVPQPPAEPFFDAGFDFDIVRGVEVNPQAGNGQGDARSTIKQNVPSALLSETDFSVSGTEETRVS